MQISVTEGGKTTFRVNDVEFGTSDVDRFPEDSLERSVAYGGIIDPAENARECELLRRYASRIAVGQIRRFQSYAHHCWGEHQMEKLLTADGQMHDINGHRRRGEALSRATWERLLAHDAATAQRERDRIDEMYGLTEHLSRLTSPFVSTYMPPRTRRWNFVREDGTLDPEVLPQPVTARRPWSWETHGDIAMLSPADLDLFMAVCAASVGSGIHLVSCSDPDLMQRWRSDVERRAPSAWDRHVEQMNGHMPTGSLQAKPELLVLFDAAETRMKEIGAAPLRCYDGLPRFQYQKWPLSRVLVGKGRTGLGRVS